VGVPMKENLITIMTRKKRAVIGTFLKLNHAL
jgi:hypothetical protein